MQKLKLRTYPFLITVAGLMAAMGGGFKAR